MSQEYTQLRLAGAAGFEPANADTKNQCLTTWRRPKANWLVQCLFDFCNISNEIFVKKLQNFANI